jgi:peptide/nickel transport system ATP-binding protein
VPSPTWNVLEVRGLTLDYSSPAGPVHALDDINLVIESGEFLGLVGESGSGKSTLAYTVVGLLPPNARVLRGEVLFEGSNLLTLSEKDLRMIRGKRVSMVFQDPTTSLNPVFKVREQLGRVIELHQGVDRRRARGLATQYLKQVELPDPDQVLDSYPFELSGGMQQRVMIAMAISMAPSLVIADEPTSAVDATIQAQILELLTRLRKEQNFSMLFITHNLDVVSQVCERVAVMYAGRIVEVGRTADVFKEPKHPYTQALLASIPRPRRSREDERYLSIIGGNVPDMTDPPAGCRFHPRCPFAFDRCKVENPEPRKVGDGHEAACHLY